MSRKKKLFLNTGTALLLQIITLICGFILPRQILSAFGSDVNGLVTSITRFLSVISFLELGVGPVIQSNLYKPLAMNDKDTISKIVVSAEKFYRKIAYIFLVYIGVLFFVFPYFDNEFGFWFTASLVLIISVGTFAQYYFGITYQVFLNADQKVYVQSSIQIVTIILNTVLSVILIRIGCSIHAVKLLSAVVFVARPLVQNWYVHHNYQIDHRIKYTEEPIKQKWNGFAQHLAAVVCGEIDVVLLTLFSSYQNVSVYSVYLLVASGINKLVLTTATGLESFWGNMLAKGERKLLMQTFEYVEVVIHAVVTLLFVSMAILITPFVSVYVKGVEDATAYYVPLFGILLSFAYGVQCLRIPYFRIIKAAGHYKETQNGAFISMALNILVSVMLVFKLELVGVAIGTIIAMLYHTIYFAWYLRRNIICRKFWYFVKHMIIDIAVCVLSFFFTKGFSMIAATYFSWIVYAFEVTLITLGICAVLNGLFYRKEIKGILNFLFNKRRTKSI